MITPYLKGVHLMLDSRRPWRKDDGWKMSIREIRQALLEKDTGEGMPLQSGGKAPRSVKWVPRLVDDIRALKSLFEPDLPPKWIVRPIVCAEVVYSFRDASGTRFGTTFVIRGALYYSIGQLHPSMTEESSNYRELANLVLALEEAQRRSLLSNTEAFFFTDNSNTEQAYYNGTS
jgi:hypothetical protein